MTNEEAVKWLQFDLEMMKFDPNTGGESYLDKDAQKVAEALDMAIDALQKQVTGKLETAEESDLVQNHAKKSKLDLISRLEATSIPILPKEHRKIFKSVDDAFETGWNEALSCVNMLPSAHLVNDSQGFSQGDCISRQGAIMAIVMELDNIDHVPQWVFDRLEDAINKVPSAQPETTLESAIDYLHSIGWMQEHDKALTESAQPERKKGKWEELGENKDGTHNIICNQCVDVFKSRGHANSYYTKRKYRFCPNCGARMTWWG